MEQVLRCAPHPQPGLMGPRPGVSTVGPEAQASSGCSGTGSRGWGRSWAPWFQQGEESGEEQASTCCVLGGVTRAPTSGRRETHCSACQTGHGGRGESARWGLTRGTGPGTPTLPESPTSRPNLFPFGPMPAGRNPCADRNGGCMHTCQALRGLAHCECHAGYRLAADRKACEGKTPSPCSGRAPGSAEEGPGPAGLASLRLLLPALWEQGWPGVTGVAHAHLGCWGPGAGEEGQGHTQGLLPSGASFLQQQAGDFSCVLLLNISGST